MLYLRLPFLNADGSCFQELAAYIQSVNRSIKRTSQVAACAGSHLSPASRKRLFPVGLVEDWSNNPCQAASVLMFLSQLLQGE